MDAIPSRGPRRRRIVRRHGTGQKKNRAGISAGAVLIIDGSRGAAWAERPTQWRPGLAGMPDEVAVARRRGVGVGGTAAMGD